MRVFAQLAGLALPTAIEIVSEVNLVHQALEITADGTLAVRRTCTI